MKNYFENQEERIDSVIAFINANGIDSLDTAKSITDEAGIDVFNIVRGVQPICFNDACWAYIVGASVAIKRRNVNPQTIAKTIGEGLQSFCADNSIAARRRVGIGHGKFASMLMDESVKCFAFLAGHESFAASSGAVQIVEQVNKVRKTPLRVILNGMGKDAAAIIARINGFTYVHTKYDNLTEKLTVIDKISYSSGLRKQVSCFGGNDMYEGLAIMELEDVDVSISGNGTSMMKYAHPVGGAYKKVCNDKGKKYFACASGGGIGRTLSPEETQAGPASYGFTDMISKMYADAIFAGSSSVPAHVEMTGYIGMGNNPMVGATVAVTVAVTEYLERLK